MNIISPLNAADAYKLSHKGMLPNGLEYQYSNETARSAKHLPVLKDAYDNKAIVFGVQRFLKRMTTYWNVGFFSRPKEEVLRVFKRRCDTFLGKDAVSMDHFAELHDLGYLPLSFKTLPEGARVNLRVPFMTWVNTNPRFAWLTNYLETYISCETWKPMTCATISFEFRKLCHQFAMETVGHAGGVEFQCHGFEFRGMSGLEDCAMSSAGHLLSFWGTDSIPAIDMLEDYYNANAEKELIACSVPASEHMVTSLGIATGGEIEFFRHAITKDYPTGIVSLVADTEDFFRVITEYATALKDDILNRKVNEIGLAKVVWRPDSGVPADILCGIAVKEIKDGDCSGYVKDLATATSVMTEIIEERVGEETPHGEYGESSPSDYFRYNGKVYKLTLDIEWNRHDKQYYYMDGTSVKSCVETTLTPEQKGAVECLWEIFGGTITEKGYKLLHERTGLIYGDSITLPIAREIFTRLRAKGFASINSTLGIGSYTMNFLTRDCLGIAIKGTWAQVDGVGYELCKTPKTDSGMKNSAKGLLRVDKVGNDYVLKDRCTQEEERGGELREQFRDGKILFETSLAEIRARINADLLHSPIG